MKKRIIFIVMLLTMVSSQIALADSGVVNTVSSSLRVRQKPSATSSTIGSLVKNAKINTLEKTGNYYKISYKGKNGYVHSSFIKLLKSSAKTTTPVVNAPIIKLSAVKVPIIEVPVTKAKPIISANGTNLVAYAYKFLGTPYKNGGTTPAIYNANGRYISGGFDCSAFVQHVYKNFGIALPRVTSDQIKKGTAVSAKNVQKGDLIFFTFSHVGIYVGNNKFMHSPKTGDVIKIAEFNTYFRQHLSGIRRIVK